MFSEHGAVPEMKEGPSEPACRSRLQTAVSRFKAAVVLCQEDAQASCCARDGGRPSGAALQEEASNCHELLKAAVVNVMVKRRGYDCVMYGSGRRAQANLR